MPPKQMLSRILCTVLLLCPAEALVGQTPGTVFGIVIDELSGAPIVGATISLMGRRDTTTADQDGFFVLDELAVGPAQLRVDFPGYSTSVEQVEIAADSLKAVEVRLLPIAATLDELKITAHRGRANAVAEVRPDVGSLTAADLLARIPGLRMSNNLATGIAIRGATSMTQSTAPAIYLDGIRIAEFVSPDVPNGAKAISILSRIPAHEVVRIAVLRGASAGAQYGDSSNGVILIETSRGTPR
jgi:hypothetical protein